MTFDLVGNYMRPGRTQTGMSLYRSPYISFHVFTWDQPKRELRPAWLRIRVGRWSDTSYFRTGLRLYRSHVKRKRISDRVHKKHVSSYGSIIFAFS